MACRGCGGSKITVRRPIVMPHRRSRSIKTVSLTKKANTKAVGEPCNLCGCKLSGKVRNTISGWITVAWCSKCKLEV